MDEVVFPGKLLFALKNGFSYFNQIRKYTVYGPQNGDGPQNGGFH